jgi:hypothetical protein
MPRKGTTNETTKVARTKKAEGGVTRTRNVEAASAVQAGTATVRRRTVAPKRPQDQPGNNLSNPRAARQPKATGTTPRARAARPTVLALEPRGINKEHYRKSSYINSLAKTEPTIVEEAGAESADRWSIQDKLEFGAFCVVVLIIGMALGAAL